MNKFLVLLVLMSFTGFSQQLTYRSGGNVYDSGSDKLQPDTVRDLMAKNRSALASYNAGRNKKTWGNVLLYGGLGLAAINLITAVTTNTAEIDNQGNVSTNKTGPEMAIIGGAMVLAAIPIKIGYSKKIKTAVENYNQNVTANDNWKANMSVVADNQGIGLKISF
ncbi:MAG: hypothetical protein V4535_07375 [Bacteroidota bacterium]